MGDIRSKNFNEPDEVVSMPNLSGEIVMIGDLYVGRYQHQPGWCWSTEIKPLVGSPTCRFHHQGVVLSGYMLLTTEEGAKRTLGPGTVFDIPPGHDACVVGDEPCITIEFLGARDWAKPKLAGERILATLLFTDIVSSTAMVASMSDVSWLRLRARHYERVRFELDRFRGYEIKTTGDGFLALFDGTARAVHCAAAICNVAQKDGIQVRVGVHSGEVEYLPTGVEGVAVHVAARIMALAGPGEVLVSASTVAMLEGANLPFADAGDHELRGLSGKRQLYRLDVGRFQPLMAIA